MARSSCEKANKKPLRQVQTRGNDRWLEQARQVAGLSDEI